MKSLPVSKFEKRLLTQRNFDRILLDRISKTGGLGLDGINSGDIPSWDRQKLSRVSHHVLRGLKGGTYSFTPYREVLIPKGRGKHPRIISVPSIKDRLALEVLAEIIRHAFRDEPVAPLPQTAVRQVAEAVRDHHWTGLVRLDIEQYYDSIGHDHLHRKISSKIGSLRLQELILRACSTPTKGPGGEQAIAPVVGVPQGTALSSTLAQVFLSDIDNEMANRADIFFMRYVDDILVLCDRENAEAVEREIRDALRARGLTCHAQGSSKFFLGDLAEGSSFLGYFICEKGPKISQSAIHRMERRLFQAFTRFRRANQGKDGSAGRVRKESLNRLEWDLRILIAGCKFEDQLRGWVRFYSASTDASQLFHLDRLVDEALRNLGIATGEIKMTRFVRTWHQVKNGSVRNFVDLDRYTQSEKKSYLEKHHGWASKVLDDLSPSALNHHFKRLCRRDVIHLEREVSPRY